MNCSPTGVDKNKKQLYTYLSGDVEKKFLKNIVQEKDTFMEIFRKGGDLETGKLMYDSFLHFNGMVSQIFILS